MSPLLARIQNLPLSSLDIYYIATTEEKSELRQLMMKKVEEFGKTQANRTAQANGFLAQRVRKSLGINLGVPTDRYDPATQTIQQVR